MNFWKIEWGKNARIVSELPCNPHKWSWVEERKSPWYKVSFVECTKCGIRKHELEEGYDAIPAQ